MQGNIILVIQSRYRFTGKEIYRILISLNEVKTGYISWNRHERLWRHNYSIQDGQIICAYNICLYFSITKNDKTNLTVAVAFQFATKGMYVYAWMYVCVGVCMYVCIVYVWVWVHLSARVWVCMKECKRWNSISNVWGKWHFSNLQFRGSISTDFEEW